MLFAIHCIDKPGHLEIRLANRPAHLAYLESFGERIVLAGPTLAADGETPNGSLIVADLEDRAAADRFCAGDPYAKAGLFERVDIARWKKVFPKA